MWLLATPIRGAGIAAGEHAGALQLVACEAGEERLSPRVETVHRHVAVEWPLREDTAQHEGCRDTEAEAVGQSDMAETQLHFEGKDSGRR